MDAEKKIYSIDYADSTTEEKVPFGDRVRAIGEDKRVGGVLFLDEAYDLEPASNPEGRAIMAEIMSAAEVHRNTVTIILAGYKDDIETKLFSVNAGMASRFQFIPFDDFNEAQLCSIWQGMFAKTKLICEGCTEDKLMRVAGRRVARGIGTKGFSNARSVRILFERALREAKKDYKSGQLSLRVDHVVGKEPTRENIPDLDAALSKVSF